MFRCEFLFCFIGGRDGFSEAYDTIYKYDASRDEWEEVGRMKERRAFHAVSTVPMSTLLKHCSKQN